VAIAIGLLKTLLEIGRSRRSGLLDAEGPRARVRLYLEDGIVVFADEGTVGETLGRILVREKVLSEEQYAAALEWMADLRGRGKGTKLGEVFVELGMLTPGQLHAALSAQVRQKVVRALGWTGARVGFVECFGPLELAERFPTPVEPLVLAALRLADRERVAELFLQAKSRYPQLRSEPPGTSGPPSGISVSSVPPRVESPAITAQRARNVSRLEALEQVKALGLRPAEHELACSLDGSRTVAQVLGSGIDVDATVVLAALLITDCLDLHPSARAPRRPSFPTPPLEGKPSVPRPSTRGTSARPLALASSVPPATRSSSRSVRPPAPEDIEQVKNVAARLRAAREAQRSLLPDHAASTDGERIEGELAIPTPHTPVAPMARLLAERAFQKGKGLVRANKMSQAVVELRRAASFYPAPEYELWAAWAGMRADVRDELRHVADVRGAAERALEQDPALGFAYFALAHVALRVGDPTRADKLFARARELDPDASEDAWDVRLRAADEPPPMPPKSPEPFAPVESSRTAVADPSVPDIAEAAFGPTSSEPTTKPSADRVSRVPLRNTDPPDPDARDPRDPRDAAGSSPQEEIPATPSGGKFWPFLLVALLVVGVGAFAWTRMGDRAGSTRDAGDAAPPPALDVTSAADVSLEDVRRSDNSGSDAAAPAISTFTPADLDASFADRDDGGHSGREASAASVPINPSAEAGAPTFDAGEGEGFLELPRSAYGHRVFVDGKLVGDAMTTSISVPCGRHTVKIGSSGRDQEIDVPCKGSVRVMYP
jgi:hypothetical protein